MLLASCAEPYPVGGPVQMAHGSEGTLLVANRRGASLSRIDIANGEETHRVETCENPHELTVSPDEAFVLVACYSGREVQFYRTETLASAGAIGLGANARVHSAIWHPGGVIVAGAEGRGSLYRIDAEMVNGFVHHYYTFEEIDAPTGTESSPGPHMVTVSPDATQAWGTIIPTGELVRYDIVGLEVLNRRTLGGQVEALALSPDGETLWVGSNADAKIYRLDAETLETEAEIAVGDVPIRIASHPSGDYVVTSNFGGGDISVVDTASNEVVRAITVSGSRDAVQVTLVFNKNGTRLYAAETANDRIAEIDFASGAVLRHFRTGPGGDGLAVID
ncbi:hypothetical protein AAW01_01170 [Aurantiacibacter gangjinensis]|uniref:YncE family protein n=1 Tax=Aurantiacibacter gangjinensis TaxID=502682 RepID=A0A0G9MS56_9SPHN|nr:hypothetical protein AAW01_01170 [Aurantiacibacter gangjinensis]